ncbi:MAG: putative metallo-hydrolase YflN [Myxococcota bacterium]|nr:putative metallo-hydrolase YflN [Myxococcota bacterium]
MSGVKGANVWVWDFQWGCVLIDSGVPRQQSAILANLQAMGRTPDHVKAMCCTHRHLDHCGSFAALQQVVRAPLIAHSWDAPAIEGREPLTSAAPGNPLKELVDSLIRFSDNTVFGYVPARVDAPVHGGERLPDTHELEVIHCPGHTPGSVCYFQRARGVLFAGDVLSQRHGRLRPPRSIFTMNREQALESLRPLAELPITAVLTAHGGPVAEHPARQIAAILREG